MEVSTEKILILFTQINTGDESFVIAIRSHSGISILITQQNSKVTHHQKLIFNALFSDSSLRASFSFAESQNWRPKTG
jgi:hypothetical protein